MTSLSVENAVLVLVDIQDKLLNAIFNKETVAKKSEILAKSAKILEISTIVTEQYPQGLGFTVDNIKSNLPTDAKFYEKTAFNALGDESLCVTLKNFNKENVVVAGIEAHICVYQTAISLLEKGYSVTILKDCCGSRQEDEYLSALNVLSNKGVQIKTTEMVLFEFLKTAKHPKFKEIQSLIK